MCVFSYAASGGSDTGEVSQLLYCGMASLSRVLFVCIGMGDSASETRRRLQMYY